MIGRVIAAATALGIVGRARRRGRDEPLGGQVVLVTGASRGFGLVLAREYARAGCRLVICARDDAELERARRDLEARGADVLAVRCDVGDVVEVGQLVDRARERFGRVDVLVNNAGMIQVAPLDQLTLGDFEQTMRTMYWGVVLPTLALLPEMRRRGNGRIVTITSIGGKVSLPHMLPYSSAKFAAVGFSEGLRAELAGSGVSVTTVVPGLMRTGSFMNALFGGRAPAESTWFGLGASLPLISAPAERAARMVVEASRRRKPELVIGFPTQAIMWAHGVFPGTTAVTLGLANRLILPSSPDGRVGELIPGRDALREARFPMLDRMLALGRSAADRYNQHPGPSPAARAGDLDR